MFDCGADCQSARRLLTGAPGGLPTRRRLPACPTGKGTFLRGRRPSHNLFTGAPGDWGSTPIPALAGVFQLPRPALDAQGRPQQPPQTVNTLSAPSNLKITDMRALTIAANYDYPIIRIDTNQGVYGLGEVRDAGGKDNALIFKGMLLGQDPLRPEQILRSFRSFSGHGRAGGGYSAIDIALHDIRGKVLGVPLWKLLGEKKRDRVRVYCDTTSTADIKTYEKRI